MKDQITLMRLFPAALAGVVVLAVVAIHLYDDTPVASLTRDPVSVLGGSVLVGAMSQLGLFLWAAGAAAGFLGAGLFGMLFGNGLFGGLGSLSSFLGLLLQIGLVVLLVRFAMSWWQRRNGTAAAYAGPPAGPSPAEQPQANARTGFGFGVGANAPPLEITPDDYDAFERLLGDVQKAWSDEDMAGLEKLTTPEMASYFAQDIAANKESGVINKVGDVKLLQGDLAEAWREGDTDYATVAMRFSMVDKTTERNGGRVVDGGDQPVEATEVWTFARQRGASGDATWELAAIQQA